MDSPLLYCFIQNVIEFTALSLVILRSFVLILNIFAVVTTINGEAKKQKKWLKDWREQVGVLLGPGGLKYKDEEGVSYPIRGK